MSEFSAAARPTSRRSYTRASRRGKSYRFRPRLEPLEGRALPATGLVAAYAFDEGAGGITADLSGNHNTGVLNNTAWSPAGKYADAFSFNGTTSSVSVSDNPSLDLTTGMTLEAWINPSALKSPDLDWCAALSKASAGTGDDISYALYAADGTGRPPAVHVFVNGADVSAEGQAALPLNRWTFLAGTYDGSTLSLYENGQLVATQAVSGSIETTADPLEIGGDSSGEMFTGLIDNVRLYNVALSQSQVVSDMNSPVTGQTSATALHVLSTSPADHDYVTGLPGNQIAVTFNHPLAGLKDGDTKVSASDPFAVMLIPRGPGGVFQAPAGLDQGSLPVHADAVYHVNADGTSTITLTPTEPLGTDVYLISISGGTTDTFGDRLTNGNGNEGNFYATFLLRPVTDASALRVVGVTEYNGYRAINNNAVFQPDTIAIAFNKPLDPLSVTAGTVQLIANPGPHFSVVPSAVGYSPTTGSVYLTPEASLTPSTVYAVRVDGSVSDDQGYPAPGYPLGATFYDTFTVINPPAGPGAGDLRVMRATNGGAMTLPQSGVIWTARVGYASVPFSETVALNSLGRFSAMLIPQRGGLDDKAFDPADVPLNAKLAFNPNTNQLIIVPTQPVGDDTYVFALNAMSSTKGDHLSDPGGLPVYATFLLRVGAGGTFVTISESPEPNATGVARSTTPGATFSRAMQPSSIRFVLAGPGGVIPASLSYDATTNTATLSPTTALMGLTTYTATVRSATTIDGVMIGPVSWSFTTGPSYNQEPLLTSANFEYMGGFRVPNGQFGASTFNYAGQGLAFNPANHSLFISGYNGDNSVAEISIPSSIVNSTNIDNLATATVLQPFVDVLNRVPDTSNFSGKGSLDLGGLMVVNGQLIGTAYVFYDTSGTTVASHYRLDGLNLATSKMEGMFDMGDPSLGAAFYDGYMAPVPAEWQGALGAPYLTGNAALAIITRTSFGPAVFGFDPSKLSSTSATPATPYVYYDQNHQTLGGYSSNPPTLYNGNTSIQGVEFIPGSRSVLFFGSVGTNTFGYGLPQDFNDNNRTAKGPHSLNGAYAYQVWAYDANDFLAVKNGQKNPWDITPYATWNFDFPQVDGAKYLGGTAFDPSTGRLYVSELNGDTEAAYTDLPVIQVYQLVLNNPGRNVRMQPAGLAAPQGVVGQPATSWSTTTVGADTAGTTSGVPSLALVPSTVETDSATRPSESPAGPSASRPLSAETHRESRGLTPDDHSGARTARTRAVLVPLKAGETRLELRPSHGKRFPMPLRSEPDAPHDRESPHQGSVAE